MIEVNCQKQSNQLKALPSNLLKKNWLLYRMFIWRIIKRIRKSLVSVICTLEISLRSKIYGTTIDIRRALLKYHQSECTMKTHLHWQPWLRGQTVCWNSQMGPNRQTVCSANMRTKGLLILSPAIMWMSCWQMMNYWIIPRNLKHRRRDFLRNCVL